MPIQYSLQENPLVKDATVYKAVVTPIDSVSQTEIAKRILERGSTVGEADILAVLSLYNQVVVSYLQEGYNVNTPLTNFKASINGNFTGMADRFDSARHSIKISTSPGSDAQKAMRDVSPEKTESALPAPYLMEFTDITSQTINDILTPGGLANLVGLRLKFDPTHAEDGIYLIDSANVATKIVSVATNKPSELVFMIPAGLAKGDYRLEVRVAYTQAKIIRTGVLDLPLTVA